MPTLYTIGHSTRSQEELLSVLKAHAIQTLVDIRAFPVSRRLPHFNRASLETALPAAGIRYVWMRELGGYRKKMLEPSPNVALRNASFRNYADYMLTAEFQNSVGELVRLAGQSRVAYMCAERVWFHCHRMLVSDWLVAHGNAVLHIAGEEPAQPHHLSGVAQLEADRLVYRGNTLFPERTPAQGGKAPEREKHEAPSRHAGRAARRTSTERGGH